MTPAHTAENTARGLLRGLETMGIRKTIERRRN